MTGTYLTDLEDVCRAAGLEVVTVDGWQTRARGSGGYADGRPFCVMWHHTASSTTPENDVAYIVTGCPDAPVANLYLDRSGAVWVCAAGATNTNGKGGPVEMSRGTVPLDQMNTYAIGIEAANNGLGEAWPAVQIDSYFALSNALAAAYGLLPTDCCDHHSWAPTRKIDPATAAAVAGSWRPSAVTSSGTWALADIRAEAVARTAPPLEEDDMTPEQAQQLTACLAAVNATNVNIWGGPNNDPPYVLSILGRLQVIETALGIDPATGERVHLMHALSDVAAVTIAAVVVLGIVLIALALLARRGRRVRVSVDVDRRDDNGNRADRDIPPDATR